MVGRRPLRAAMLTGLMAIAGPALAEGNSGEADPSLLLGPLRTFPTEAEAKQACGGDTVVWAERYAGYYFFPGEARYGSAPMGAFACQRQAEGANYWDINPMGSILGYHGKVFPRTWGEAGS